MIRVIILIMFALTIVYSSTYPIMYSKMGTPLYQASDIFDKYSGFESIKLYAEEYKETIKPIIEFGYKLDKSAKPQKKDILNYLKKLRGLQKKYDHMIHMFSSLLIQSIDGDDYTRFRQIASIEIDTILRSNTNNTKIISYYKKNIDKGKIKNIEMLIQHNKMKNSIKSIDTRKKTKPAYDIYWMSSIGDNKGYDSGIYGANINALDVSTKIIDLTTRINPCTVDEEGNIYWCDVTNHAIYKAEPDGSNIIKIISDLEHPIGIAIDNNRQRIYWANWLKNEKKGVVGYSSFSKNGRNIVVSDELRSGGHLFYDTQYDKLYASDLFGNKVIYIDLKTNKMTKLASAKQASDIVVDYENQKVVWADLSADNISSINFDGSDKKVLIQFKSQFANPDALTIDTVNKRLVYAIYYPDISEKRLETANLDGTNRKVAHRALKSSPGSLFSAF